MNFFLKILNEARSRQRLKVDGWSNARFIFEWDPKLRAYKYLPKSQAEVDDLFATMGRSTAYKFAPVGIEVTGLKIIGEPPEITEPVTLEAGTNPPLNDVLVEECLHRGIIVTDADTDSIARRLAEAYDKGAADSLNSLPAVVRKPRKQAEPKAPAKPRAPKPAKAEAPVEPAANLEPAVSP